MTRTVAALILLGVATLAHGQSDERKANRERETARRLQAQIQKLEAEKSQLQQEGAEQLKQRQADLDKRNKANAGLQRQLGEAKKREEASAKELQSARDATTQAQAKLVEQQAQSAGLKRQLTESEAEGRRLAAELKDAKAQLEQQREIIARQAVSLQEITDKNLRLYQFNADLLERYNRKGVWDAMLQKEPVTQIKDVQMQALLQEYRDKLNDLKVEKPQIDR